jgi:hypothetical protein
MMPLKVLVIWKVHKHLLVGDIECRHSLNRQSAQSTCEQINPKAQQHVTARA